MTDYKKILKVCLESQEVSRKLIDEFLLHYADSKDKLSQQMDLRLKKYKHITRKFDKSWLNMLRAQYIAHRVFRKGGLINKYLKHAPIKNLIGAERDFLRHAAENSWRFSFAMIVDNPETNFYEMEDVFTGEHYLLYSENTGSIITISNPVLFFNLIGYNGACYQSYGPIAHYAGFDPDDIFFFASEINFNNSFAGDDDLVQNIEENPVPYMMLLAGSSYPETYFKDDRVNQCVAEYSVGNFTTHSLRDDFTIEYNADVYRLMLKGWDTPPHFADAYFDEKTSRLTLHAMTDRGFSALARAIEKHGYPVESEPYIRLSPAMKKTAEDILKRDMELNPYNELFRQDVPEEQAEEIEKINALLDLVIPEINSGKTPNIELLAKKTGVDPGVARDLINQFSKQS